MSVKRWIAIIAIAGMFLPAGCTAPASNTPAAPVTAAPAQPGGVITLDVYAAASLADAFQEIGADYSRDHPGIKVTFNFAGSQQLSEQIGQGAPADVFASADQTQMNKAVATGRINLSQVHAFAGNRLVVVYPQSNPAHLTRLQDLARPGLKLILAAAAVPAGHYALDFLDKAGQDPGFDAGFKQKVLANVVSYEETVRAVLSKVSLGEADAGIVYQTDATSPSAEGVGTIAIPDALNSLASYPVAVLSDSAHTPEATGFVAYLLSTGGQATLKKYGFLPPAS